MDISTIYEKFDRIGCLTFATIDQGIPQTRIAHLIACDHEGLYFQTMITKPFYAQIKDTGKVSVCGMFPETSVSHDEHGMSYFKPGYTIRAAGDVREIPFDILREKATANEKFMPAVKDIERYPAMTTFCIFRAWGEVYDFDFEMEQRSHKLLRSPFSFGGIEPPFRGMHITEECILCGECMESCSFKAIYKQDERFLIDHEKCDVCGDCYTVCPADAVEIVIDAPPSRPAPLQC